MRLTPDRKGERTLTPLPDRLWNLATAFYYKCGGKPWRLATARDGEFRRKSRSAVWAESSSFMPPSVPPRPGRVPLGSPREALAVKSQAERPSENRQARASRRAISRLIAA
jgi:hypothetical protein